MFPGIIKDVYVQNKVPWLSAGSFIFYQNNTLTFNIRALTFLIIFHMARFPLFFQADYIE